MDTKPYKITQLGDYSYSLFSKGKYSLQLYSSIIKSHLLTSVFHDPRKNSIFFTAATVQTLTEYLKTRTNTKMSERECAKLIYNLTTQIQYLEEREYILYGYNLNDILVINEQTFIVASANYILPLELETKSIIFYSPIIRPFFSSPELLELTNLPSSIYYKSGYYSLGGLVVFCLLNKNVIQTNVSSDKEIETILRPIKYSKVYWFIKRCLNKRYEQRVLLFI
jgi:hypothetical protein